MTQRARTILATYSAGPLLGLALVMMPAAGPMLVDPAMYGLASSQFGLLFGPQIVAAIGSSLLAAAFGKRAGMKRIFVGGVAGLGASMAVFAFVEVAGPALTFSMLLLANAFLGIGFGLTSTAMNAYAFDLFPGRSDTALTGLQAIAGAGQLGAPLVLGAFVWLGIWWGAPGVVVVFCFGLAIFQSRLPLTLASEKASVVAEQRRWLPRRLWLMAAVVFMDGVVEGTLAIWSPIYLEQDAGLTKAQAGLALSIFWGAVTVGRIVFAVAARGGTATRVYKMAPFLFGALMVTLPLAVGVVQNMIFIALLGLTISFFFPMSISLASRERPDLLSEIAGVIMASVMLGIGFSAVAIGMLREAFGLALLFECVAVVAVVMGVLVVYLFPSLRKRTRVH